jgi:hypothetical protein
VLADELIKRAGEHYRRDYGQTDEKDGHRAEVISVAFRKKSNRNRATLLDKVASVYSTYGNGLTGTGRAARCDSDR